MKEYSSQTKEEFRNIICNYYSDISSVGAITNLNEMLDYAQMHELSAIFYYMLLNQKDYTSFNKNEILNRYYTYIRHNALFAKESKELGEYLTKENIMHSFIKGQFIKDLYHPKEVRSMGDADIYVKGDIDIKPYFSNKGYNVSNYYAEVTSYDKDNIEFEIHKKIEWFGIDWSPYCSFLNNNNFDIKSHAMLLIVHAMKHLVVYGLGIRQILDIALVLRQDSTITEDENFLKKLKELSIFTCYNTLISLINKWFKCNYRCEKVEDKAVFALESAIENGGVFGFNLNDYATVNIVNKKSKFKMYKDMLFPSYERMVLSYPKLKDKKWLLGYYYIKRLFTRGLKEKRYKIIYKNSTEDNLKAREDFVKLLDIDKQYYSNL